MSMKEYFLKLIKKEYDGSVISMVCMRIRTV